MPDKAVVLSVDRIKKKIKNRWIIKGISFEVREGEVFGFLGPNGAGKTTTIRMLVDLIKPTEGTIRIAGIPLDSRPTEALLQVGCIVENPELYAYLSGWENLGHFARMLPGVDERRITEVVEIVGLDQRIHDKVKTYSLGMRQRLGIAQALLGRPKLLILDEPTNGLDPQGIKEMRMFIRQLAAVGISVFVSSHLLSEIQLMCDRVAIISHGEVIAVGEVNELLRETEPTVVWELSPLPEGRRLLAANPDLKLSALTVAEAGDDARAGDQGDSGRQRGRISVVMSLSDIPSSVRRLVEAGVSVHAIEPKMPTLEDLFLRLTEGERIE